MKTYRALLVSVLLLAGSLAFGQNATLVTDTAILAQSGGTLVLRATAEYAGTPGALSYGLAAEFAVADFSALGAAFGFG